jgi:error-prone DNA polymerase
VLALGILSAIRRTLDVVSEQRGERFEMQGIRSEDPETYEMILRPTWSVFFRSGRGRN